MRERIWPLIAFAAALVLAFAVAYQTMFYYLITSESVAEEKSIAMQAGGIGVLGRSVALRNTFVNPDFDYEACVFDVRSTPYILKAPDTDEYWSMAIMNRSGEAMFSVAGPDHGTGKWGPYLLRASGLADPAPSDGFKVIGVPQGQGIVVFRLLSNRTNRIPLSDLQDELRCEVYRPKLN